MTSGTVKPNGVPRQIRGFTQLNFSALAAANAAGRGTVVLNDRLVEHHHIEAAQRLLSLSEMITKLENVHG